MWVIYENKGVEYVKSRALWPVGFKSIGCSKTLLPLLCQCLFSASPYSPANVISAVYLLMIVIIQCLICVKHSAEGLHTLFP